MNLRSCFTVFVFFAALFVAFYLYFSSGVDCIRMIPDGAVRCSCDFPSMDDYKKYKNELHGAWEAVVFDDPDFEPCKK